MIDFSGKRVVIFGGGEVGARKAAYFCNVTSVTVISRSFSPAFNEIPVRKVETNLSGLVDYDLENLVKDTFLVIAATRDISLNDRIGRFCLLRGILFNNADGKPGDVVLPSQAGGEHYTIGISTGGSSPVVSRFLREHIARTFPNLDLMIELQDRLRSVLKRQVPEQEKRSAILHDVIADPDIWKALEGGQKPAWDIIERRYLC